ncbi:MAG: LysR family transcriptional regulator [Deltaproteobacteria bacterium]|nr:LysR family transcriptional regulator [Deltaproteobacteria bacterium]MBI3295289.1 LysR family transcriptional regulator [Deltaproteobacteria bacterium]
MSLSSLNLDAFFACARAGHFTRAAKSLAITQSALSQRISNLEEELGTSVFVRERAGLRLTPAGEELLRFCAAKESLEQELVGRVKQPDDKSLQGSVRIGGFSSVMRSIALPSLAPLLSGNPEVALTLISKEMDELPNLLRRGEIDYLILYEELIRDGIESIFLGEEANTLIEKRGYNGPDLFLDHDENDQTTTKYLRLKRKKGSVKRRYLDDVYGLIDGVKQGLGRAVVPIHLIHGERELSTPDRGTILNIPVYLHFYHQPFYTQLHQRVVDSLKVGFRKCLAP